MAGEMGYLFLRSNGVDKIFLGIFVFLLPKISDNFPNFQVIAISTVHGCVNVDQATANVFRTLRANNVTRRIPVYKGATWPLIRMDEEGGTETENVFFGKDGVGDAPEAWPKVEPEDFTSHETEVAALALLRLTKVSLTKFSD